jgi:hypothetical protein
MFSVAIGKIMVLHAMLRSMSIGYFSNRILIFPRHLDDVTV